MLKPDLARIRSFNVVPSLPEALQPLLRIAYNLWWTWHPEAVELFVQLDRNLWSKSKHNPVLMLGMCSQERLDEAARDEAFLASLHRCIVSLDRHINRTPWLQRREKSQEKFTVAYFCAEFGLAECLQVYSGGLGILAGDHLKSASELGMPLVAVGLLYRYGYFQQYLNADGWQQEYYPDLDFANLPMTPVSDPKTGQQLRVSVDMLDRVVQIAVWRVIVGRVDLFLLDTNLPENDPADRGITGQLYGGDMELRIRQEIVLGIGGVRALAAMGIEPDLCHMNEGHSAFLALERIRLLIEKHNITFDEARQQAAASHIFTTHTPVPAGIDRFPPDMIARYFKNYHPGLRLDLEGLLALGRENVFNRNEFFSMAVLAIRTADSANGVSKLHGVVSRSMWQGIWPGVPVDEVPITHVTNGVHARSWMSGELIELLNRYLGTRWMNDPSDQTIWKSIHEAPDEELWRIHEQRRHRLVIWARRRLRAQLEHRNADPRLIEEAAEALDPKALTIGFARRFATYKRGNLLLRDAERLKRLLSDHDRPVQFLVAGKSHPADSSGKELIRNIVSFAREFKGPRRIVFIENYDINVARYLVQGCDLWLNTPRRGMEASGTSGMKAALNGVLNCSIRDGWWDEVHNPETGWSIGRGESYSNIDMQDDLESQALYNLLEKQIIPLFYNRDDNGLPRAWVGRMKKCIAELAPVFNTNRMVEQYTEDLYLPALRRARKLSANGLKGAVELARLKEKLHHAWGRLSVEIVECDTLHPMGIHTKLPVGAIVNLADLDPSLVKVQVYHGPVDNDGRINEGKVTDLTYDKSLGDGRHHFVGSLRPATSGRHGLAVRIVPGGDLINGLAEPGLILWDKAAQTAPPPKLGVVGV